MCENTRLKLIWEDIRGDSVSNSFVYPRSYWIVVRVTAGRSWDPVSFLGHVCTMLVVMERVPQRPVIFAIDGTETDNMETEVLFTACENNCRGECHSEHGFSHLKIRCNHFQARVDSKVYLVCTS